MTTLLSTKTLLLTILSIWMTQIVAESTRSSSSSSSIYEALSSHGLPMGLLPKGVKNYSLADDGRFVVHLDQACNAKFESELHYDRNVTGWLSYGQIGNLTGISAQELFLWFPVKGIRVDIPTSGLIYFDVGVVFKRFQLSLFETPPECLAASNREIEVEKQRISHPLIGREGAMKWPSNRGEFGRDSI